MDRCSRAYVIVGVLFLCCSALAERKINLEDIERDNLRAESKSKSDNARSDEGSYDATDKPATSQSDYQQESRYQSEDRSSSYSAPQQIQDKYAIQSEDYEQNGKYSENDIGYQKTAQPIQQYTEYHHHQQQQQEVEEEVPKVSHASTYAGPQLFYQQEVIVGNQYQTLRQKEATEKYGKSPNKETLYVNIPMAQLLSYYPNLSINKPSISKTEIQPLLHRLATEAARQITIPVYTPSYSRDAIHSPSKVAYQIQPQYQTHGSKYSQHTEAILPTKQPNKLIYTETALSHQTTEPQAQPQQYLQEIVYTHPGVVYAPEVSSSHADVYARPSVYLQGNGPSRSYASQSRHQQQYTPYTQPETYYSLHAANYAPQLTTNQIYQQQHSAENVLQNYEDIPESPGSGLDLPRLPAQNFKSGTTLRLVPVSSESEGSHYTQNHLDHSSEPKSLLDSYVPSRLIAAQDAERYRERPIRLERGFLPSKSNFVQSYKKRKAE